MAPPIRSIALKVCLALLACLMFLGGQEAFLATGVFDGLDKDRPVWIPPGLRAADRRVTDENRILAAQNPFGFTDPAAKPGSHPGRTRVVVLGDSYVWGDGLAAATTWPHLLRERLEAARPGRFEVLSWGLCGWATVHQLVFLEKHGDDFKPDAVLVGFVSNDPDMLDRRQRRIDPNGPPWSWLAKPFPRGAAFLSGHVEALLSRFLPGWGYERWEDGLYTAENLERYDETLAALQAWCSARRTRLVFLLTPNADYGRNRRRFDALLPLLRERGIEHRDLLPPVSERFAGRSERSLWANPANPHPCPAMHALFAEQAADLLLSSPAGRGPRAY
ncbi:MAG: SGNH/GDSL hydrolase family protein [Elusimicrobiota bacterium]|jgi:hypothetical protein